MNHLYRPSLSWMLLRLSIDRRSFQVCIVNANRVLRCVAYIQSFIRFTAPLPLGLCLLLLLLLLTVPQY